MTTRPLPLKQYLEAVAKRCSELSHEELVEMILDLAREVPARVREEFLDRISASLQDRLDGSDTEAILLSVQGLKEEIEERASSMEDGTFWEDRDNQADWWDGDEEPPPLSDDQEDDLRDLVLAADRLFLAGRLKEAGEIYGALREIVDEDGPVSEGDLDLEWRETRARHARCVYESNPFEARAEKMLEVMAIHARLSTTTLDLLGDRLPLLQDVANARAEEPPDWPAFLPRWREALANPDTDRAAVLLLEVTHMLEHTAGVMELARAWKESRPWGYLYWIHLAREENDWPAVGRICREALADALLGTFRATVAAELVEAGKKTGQAAMILEGRRELCRIKPTRQNVFLLLVTAENQGVKGVELSAVIDFLRGQPSNEDLYCICLLLDGRLQEAFQAFGERAAPVGWSYGHGEVGVLFSGILTMLAREDIATAPTIGRLLLRHVDQGSDVQWSGDNESSAGLTPLVLDALRRAKPTQEQTRVYLDWAVRVGGARIEKIVSNQHRKAYRRAAEVLCALSECLQIMGDEPAGRRIVTEFRDEKFRRYSAFRKEVDKVVSQARMLRGR